MAFAPPPLESLVEEEPESKAPAFFSPPPVDALVSETGPIKQAIGRYAQGLSGMVAGIPESIGIGATKLGDASEAIGLGRFGQPKTAEETGSYKTGRAIRKLYSTVYPVDEARPKNFIIDTLPSGAGSMVGAIGGGAAGRLAKLPAWLSVASTGAAAGGAAGYEEAKAAGGDDDQAWTSFLLNAGLGTTEAVPIARWLTRANKVSGGAISRAIKEGAEETIQEVFQQVGGNVAASDIAGYDPNRPWYSGAVEGGAAGLTLGTLGSLLLGRRGRIRNTTPQGKTETPAFFTPPPPIATPETDPNVLNVDVEAFNRESMRPEADAATDRVTAAISDRKQIAGADARLAGARDRLPQMGYAYNEVDDVFIPVRQVEAKPIINPEKIDSKLIVQPPAPAPASPAPVAPVAPVVVPPVKPQVANLASESQTKIRNQFGDPSGTTYHATPEDWTEWERLMSRPMMEEGIWPGREGIKNKYGGMPPEPPIASQESKEKTTAAARIAKTTVPPPVVLETPVPVKPVLKSIREQASEFNQIIRDNADEQRWVRGQTLDDLHLIDPGTSNLGTMGIRGSIKRRQALKIAQVNVAKALGLDPNQIGSEKYRSENLPKLQEFIAQKKNFQEATKDEGDSSGKIGVEIEDVKVGDTLTVDGEQVRVASSNKDFVVLEDGRKFGRQEVGKGETIYVEGYEPKVEPTAPVPTIKPGQQTADLIDSAARDVLSLTGETGADAEKAAADKAKADADKAEAKRIEAERQKDLFGEEKPKDSLPRKSDGRLQIYELTNAQLKALAQAVGYDEKSYSGLGNESVRQTLVNRLQDLEDKKLLDSSVLTQESPKPQQPEKPNEEAKEEATIPTEANTGQSYEDGSKVRVGNNPQTHTIVRETTDPKFPDERIFEVQNDKTGDKSEIDQKSLTPIKERTAEERAKGKKTGKAELDALLKDAGLDPSVFPDAKSKKNALERADAKLAEIQKKIRGGKTFTGILGVEPLILDAAITAARGVLRATNSLLQAIQAAIDYIRTNQAGVELNEDDARNYFARELAGNDAPVEPQEPETETAEPPSTPPPTNPAPPTAPPSEPENQLEFGTIVDPATGQRVPNTEGDQETVQIAGITYSIIGKERLTPEQKSAADTKVREYFEKELTLPGEPDLSQGRRRGSTDLNIVFTITPDGENHDAAGERLVAHLVEEIQKQHQPGGDPAYVSSLVNAINKNFNVGNLNGVFSDDTITRLMNVSASESSWRGTMLRAITGITEDMGTVARNAKFFLRRTHENMFGGDLVRKIMDRIANNFREVFMSGDEIERLYNSNPILQEMFLKVVNRLKVKPSLREVIQEIFNTRIDKQDDIVEKFVDTMVNKFSATPEEAAKLKAEFGKTFVESFKAARVKAQEKALETLLPEERQAIGIQTPLWKKLTDLVNSGWFDSAKVVEEYARSKGMVIPSEAELERMRQWSIQEQSLREPTFEEVQAADKDEAKALAKVSAATLEKRQELLRKMNTQWSRWTHPIIRRKEFLQDFSDPQKRYNTAMAANEWLAANLLLKIGFGTRQVFDIATQMVLHTPTRAMQYAFEQHANDKSAGRDSNLLHNISQSMTDAYRTRIKVLGDTLASFKRTLAGKGEQKNVEQLISSIAVFDRALLRAEEMKMEGKPAAARFLQVLALMMRFGRQFAAAADVIQGVPAEAQEIAHQIRTGLLEQGKGQAQQDLEFNNILGLLTTARQESINEARQILESRGLDTSKASVQRAAWHILREKIYQMAKTAGLPADEWKVQNHYFRNVIGWNEPESQGFGGIGGPGGLVAMTARGGKEVMSKLGIPAFPFVFGNAMGISLNRKLAYTPLGFFSGFFKGSPWFEGERMIRQRKIEATIGTTIGSTLFTLVALGILRVLPSFWPRDDKERAEWVAKGWQPGQVIVPWGEGQEWAIGTRVGPLGLVAPYLAAGGAFRKAIEDKAKKQEQLNQQAAKLGLEPEQLEGLDPAQWVAIVGAAGWASATGGRTASGMIGSYTDFGNPSIKKSSASAVSTLVPGLPAYQEIARMNGVSINPKLASFWDLVVPMETSDANRVNLLGDPMRNENDVERIFKVLSGGTSPLPRDSDEFKQNKAYVNLFDSDFRPPSINPQRGYQFGNELRPMTQPELQRYTVARGKNFASELQAIDVNGLVPEEAKKVVQQAFKRANVKALEEVGVTGNAIKPPNEPAPSPASRTSRSSFRSSFGRSRGTRSSLASYRQPRLRSSRRRGRRISTGFRRTRRNRIRRTYSTK